MDALLISAMICALFVLGGLAERFAFAALNWVLTEPPADLGLVGAKVSSEYRELDVISGTFRRSPLTGNFAASGNGTE